MLGREKRLRKREDRIAGLVRKEETRQSEKGISSLDSEGSPVPRPKQTEPEYDLELIVRTNAEEAEQIEIRLRELGIEQSRIVRKNADSFICDK